MAKLKYVIGDATDPIVKPALICHVCNNIGAWGRGFVMALSNRNTTPEKAYRAWYDNRHNLDSQEFKRTIENVALNPFHPLIHGRHPLFQLGKVQIALYTPQVFVANMIAQEGVQRVGKTPPIRYDALESCLKNVYCRCSIDGSLHGFTVHMPRIGCDLAGGEWSVIKDIIKRTMTVDTTVYTLESQKDRWPQEESYESENHRST